MTPIEKFIWDGVEHANLALNTSTRLVPLSWKLIILFTSNNDVKHNYGAIFVELLLFAAQIFTLIVSSSKL